MSDLVLRILLWPICLSLSASPHLGININLMEINQLDFQFSRFRLPPLWGDSRTLHHLWATNTLMSHESDWGQMWIVQVRWHSCENHQCHQSDKTSQDQTESPAAFDFGELSISSNSRGDNDFYQGFISSGLLMNRETLYTVMEEVFRVFTKVKVLIPRCKKKLYAVVRYGGVHFNYIQLQLMDIFIMD